MKMQWSDDFLRDLKSRVDPWTVHVEVHQKLSALPKVFPPSSFPFMECKCPKFPFSSAFALLMELQQMMKA